MEVLVNFWMMFVFSDLLIAFFQWSWSLDLQLHFILIVSSFDQCLCKYFLDFSLKSFCVVHIRSNRSACESRMLFLRLYGCSDFWWRYRIIGWFFFHIELVNVFLKKFFLWWIFLDFWLVEVHFMKRFTSLVLQIILRSCPYKNDIVNISEK